MLIHDKFKLISQTTPNSKFKSTVSFTNNEAASPSTTERKVSHIKKLIRIK